MADVVQFDAGGQHVVMLRADGTVWTVGANDSGQLGDGTFTTRRRAVQATYLDGTPLTRIVAVGAGGRHSIVLRDDGTVWTFGMNARGQLGDGTIVDSPGAIQATYTDGTPLTGFVQVGGGERYSIALRSDGTVWTWGLNSNGQLGIGSTVEQWRAVQAQYSGGAPLTDIVAVAGGGQHAAALRHDGTVWAWGRNNQGQLGDGTTTQRTEAVQATFADTTPITNAAEVEIGSLHTLVRRGDGTVWAFGGNADGQLGDDGISTQPRAVQVVHSGGTPLTNVIDLNANNVSTAVRADGTVWSWGLNSAGQLGDGTNVNRNHAVQMLFEGGGAFTQARLVVGGQNHISIVRSDGTVWASGSNGWGQIGNGGTLDVWGAVASTYLAGSPATAVRQVALGAQHAVLLRSDGTVWTSGSNTSGQLGDGTTTERVRIVRATYSDGTPLSRMVAVAAGGTHSVALRDDGTVWTFGSNVGNLGDGSTVQRTRAVQATYTGGAPLTNITAVAAGAEHTVARRADGTVWAFGRNTSGQLGDGGTTTRTRAVQVTRSGGLAVTHAMRVAGGSAHTTIAVADGTVLATGLNDAGQLGNGSTTTQTRAVQSTQSGGAALGDVTAIAAGHSHNVVMRAPGTVWAYGRNASGQLGDGGTTNRTRAVQTTISGGSAATSTRAIGAGDDHSAIVGVDGSVRTTGLNGSGQLGDTTMTNRTRAVLARYADGTVLSQMKAVTGGQASTAALRSDGTVWMTGSNASGQFGNCSTTSQTGAVQALHCDDATPPPAPAAVRDGPGADITWQTGTASLTVNWDAVVDADSGVERYETCFSAVTSCGGTPVAGWASVGVATTDTRTGLALAHGTTYYACVRAVDNARNVGSMTCSNGVLVDTVAPPEPAPVYDGSGADIEWTASTTQLQANWAAVVDSGSGLNRYEFCMASSATCSSGVVQAWTSAGGSTSVTQGSLSLTTGTTYYTCVRAVDNAGLVSSAACSNGQTVDASAPSVPATVNDGTGSDIESTGSTTELSANWTAASDVGSGLNRYEFCMSTSPTCASGVVQPWTSTGTSTSVTQGSLSLVTGTTYYVCVRTFDDVGNQSSGIACSNGQRAGVTITVALSNLGYTSASRVSGGPIAFDSLFPGTTREIGPVGSGQATAGAATEVTVTSTVDTMLQVSSTDWSTGTQTMPASQLSYKHHGVAEAWTPMSTMTETVEASVSSGTNVFSYDYRLTVPAAQRAGSYSASVTYTATAAP